MISDKHELIFIHSGRTAGTALKKCFNFEFITEDNTGHKTAQEHSEIVPDRWKSFHVFTIVRNPFSRLVSAFQYATQKVSYWHNNIHPEDSRSHVGKHPEYENLKDLTFKEAVLNLDELEHETFRPQFNYICDNDGELMVQSILLFENLEYEFKKKLEPKIQGNSSELQRINTSDKKKLWPSMYDEDTLEKAYSYYYKDFQLFNYG